MSSNTRHVINMANSIIGVSILSMPYCFKEAGLILGIILILLSGFMTKKTCMYLIRSAIMARRRSYELLAFQVFGLPGKLFMELCLICFLLGICISFHVVMGDLAPAIVAKYMEVSNSPSLRGTLLIGIVLLVILPLCLLRNIDSLASMSACSIGFYVFLNTVMFHMALPRLLDGSWISSVKLFQFEKTFSVLPILSLALSCQSNVFEIYDSLPDPDVGKMESVVSQAVNLCCALYIGVGFFGYVAFSDVGIAGNVIMSFPNSGLTDGISMFFVISLAISFPLMLFPCRTSIHSLLYRRNTQVSYDLVGNFMPEIRFKLISVCVLAFSLFIGILLPNIEIVLGLLGSTMGMLIALVLPSIFFIKVYTKASIERLLAQGFLLFGIFMMVTGTFLNLHKNHEQKILAGSTVSPKIDMKVGEKIGVINLPHMELAKSPSPLGRKEPAVPEPPAVLALNPKMEAKAAVDSVKAEVKAQDPVPKISPVSPANPMVNAKQPGILEVKKPESLHPDALQKEEKEHAEEAGKKEEIEQKQEEILIHIEEQKKKQEEMLEILHELKEKSIKDDNEAKGEPIVPSPQTKNVPVPVNQSKMEPVKAAPSGVKVPQRQPPAVKSPTNETRRRPAIVRRIPVQVRDGPVPQPRAPPQKEVPLAQNLNKLPPVIEVKKHDEERRRRRDVETLSNPLANIDLPHANEHMTKEDPLRSVREVNIGFDTRQLLWNGLKIRRRKRKYKDNPDYWDEM